MGFLRPAARTVTNWRYWSRLWMHSSDGITPSMCRNRQCPPMFVSTRFFPFSVAKELTYRGFVTLLGDRSHSQNARLGLK